VGDGSWCDGHAAEVHEVIHRLVVQHRPAELWLAIGSRMYAVAGQLEVISRCGSGISVRP
jgi:hypothetical protein